MALSTYSDLLAAVSNWLGGRSDLNAFIPDFVRLFEVQANRRLRTIQMQATTTLTQTGGVATLPTDFLAARHVTWAASSNVELEYVQPAWFALNYPTNPTGNPNVYTIEGTSLKIVPTGDTTGIRLVYWQEIPPLSGIVNWLYSDNPDCYLFGSLAESGDFTSNDNQLQKWIARRDAIFQEINTQSAFGVGVGGIKVATTTP
jgi:hypothetical protein